MQNKKINFGFTFVELIVITVILVILSAIGFVSYTGYLAGVRDSNRISQLNSMRDGLEMIKSTGSLPLPEDSVQVVASGIQVGYQGYAGDSTLSRIDFKEGGKDPKDKTYYSYYVTKDKKYFQLMLFLEDKESNQTSFLIPSTYAATLIDYSIRSPYVTGNNLGIFTDMDNTPIQEISSIKSVGILDIVSVGSSYISYISNTKKLTGNGTILSQSIPNKSCKRIQESGSSNGDGVYMINPTGAMEIEVYCDMTTNGGGRTLVHKTTSSEANLVGNLDTTEGYPNWNADNEYRLNIDFWKDLSTEAIMAKNIRIDGVAWDDITDATITSIDTNQVILNITDPYYIFNEGSQNTCTDGTNYWNFGCCYRCVNYSNDISSYGANKQPMVYKPYTSYSGSAIEGAGGTDDADWHVLAKMGIFIK
ncbi:hypothetical protein HGA92_01910 [Candidatus Gracilibacteria bacterium]|nr:hypothetical protein [Candidatus Gracilibacteria bacterium]NUJ99465.1 hypothetical protein [Candidatus Gracilibacteria bacterium]